MIGTINIQVNAHHPNLPLETIFAHVGSPSSVRVIDVPKKIGTWKITKVYITANYPDNTIQSTECVLTGGCYVGTLPASSEIGKSVFGFKITADGIDENDNAVEGYVLGKGDIVILSDDAEITTGKRAYYLHLKDEIDSHVHKGDFYFDDISGWMIYNDGWSPISKSISWGDIAGTLSSQTDLDNVLTQKASKSYVDNGLSDMQQSIDEIRTEIDGVADIIREM